MFHCLWPRRKILLIKHFCLRVARNVSELFQKHCAVQVIAYQAVFIDVHPLLDSESSNVRQTMLDQLARA